VTNLKVVLAVVIAIVIGLVSLIYGSNGDDLTHKSAAVIGGAIFPIAVVGLVYELWLRRSLVSEFLVASNLREDIFRTGIREVRPFDQIDWRKFFIDNPGDVEIVVGYGKTWSAQWAGPATRIIGERGDRLKVMVLDPNGSPALLNFYAEMYGASTGVDELRGRIREAIASWRTEVERARAEHRRAFVVIEGIGRHVPFTFYRSGDAMWVVMAPRAPGRASEGIPAYACVKTSSDSGLYDWVLKDIEACRRDGVTHQIEELRA
jgi:hypothetical protein